MDSNLKKRLDELLEKYESIPENQVQVNGSEIAEMVKLMRELEKALENVKQISTKKLSELAERVREMESEEGEESLPEFYIVAWADEGLLYYRAFEGEQPDDFYRAIGGVPRIFLQGNLLDHQGLEDDDEWVAARQQELVDMIRGLGGLEDVSSVGQDVDVFDGPEDEG